MDKVFIEQSQKDYIENIARRFLEQLLSAALPKSYIDLVLRQKLEMVFEYLTSLQSKDWAVDFIIKKEIRAIFGI